MTEHIVAIFETESTADAAVRDLISAGVPATAIRRYRPDAGTAGTASTGGFWAWLLGEEDGIEAQRARFPNDHAIYDDRARGGNAVVSVTLADDLMAREAATLLESHHPLRLDEDPRSTDSGLGMTTSADVRSTADMRAAADTRRMAPEVVPVSAEARMARERTDNLAAERQRGAVAEEVIPIKEEQIQIGKRVVDHGVTRLRRYVVESPVEKDVTLHGERVTIERRRPVDGRAGGAFEERTIEVRETEEVPVVEKTARVVEEVTIRKEATERTEKVRDTVRREEVEVTGDASGMKVPLAR